MEIASLLGPYCQYHSDKTRQDKTRQANTALRQDKKETTQESNRRAQNRVSDFCGIHRVDFCQAQPNQNLYRMDKTHQGLVVLNNFLPNRQDPKTLMGWPHMVPHPDKEGDVSQFLLVYLIACPPRYI